MRLTKPSSLSQSRRMVRSLLYVWPPAPYFDRPPLLGRTVSDFRRSSAPGRPSRCCGMSHDVWHGLGGLDPGVCVRSESPYMAFRAAYTASATPRGWWRPPNFSLPSMCMVAIPPCPSPLALLTVFGLGLMKGASPRPFRRCKSSWTGGREAPVPLPVLGLSQNLSHGGTVAGGVLGSIHLRHHHGPLSIGAWNFIQPFLALRSPVLTPSRTVLRLPDRPWSPRSCFPAACPPLWRGLGRAGKVLESCSTRCLWCYRITVLQFARL